MVAYVTLGFAPDLLSVLGETGIPRFTPLAFGLAFRQRVEGMLDDEIARHGEEGRRRSRFGPDKP
jgi:hypothetical protein